MKAPKPFWTHFGLKRNPFGNIQTVNDVFESSEMERAMDHLAEAVEEGGIFAVIGERGIGKTTVKNEILQFFMNSPTQYAYSVLECMNLSDVSMSTILTALVHDLSSEPRKMNTEHRSRQVRRIIGNISARKKVVLIIDEAQKLKIPVLEQLKQLTEMTWGLRSRIITVLLIGQPELRYKLSRDEGLDMRVTRYNMTGLTTDEVLQYIDLRCRAAGGDMVDVFEPDALAYIAENQHSPLHINHICSTTMRMTRRSGDKKVTLAIVYECGGIRTPREVLRDNNITIRKFSRMISVHEDAVYEMLNGEHEKANEEQQGRFKEGMSKLMRGSENVYQDGRDIRETKIA
jgi:general secretion pathway protein A